MVAGGGDGVVEGVPASTGAPRPDAASLPTPGGIPSARKISSTSSPKEAPTNCRRISSPSSPTSSKLGADALKYSSKTSPRDRSTHSFPPKSGSLLERRLSNDESKEMKRPRDNDSSHQTQPVAPSSLANSICDDQQLKEQQDTLERSISRNSKSVSMCGSTEGGANGVYVKKSASVTIPTALPSHPTSVSSSSSSQPYSSSPALARTVSSSFPSRSSLSSSQPLSSSVKSQSLSQSSLSTLASSSSSSPSSSSNATITHVAVSLPSSSTASSATSPSKHIPDRTSPPSTKAHHMPQSPSNPSQTISHQSPPSTHHRLTSPPICDTSTAATSLSSTSSPPASQSGFKCSTPLTSPKAEPSVQTSPSVTPHPQAPQATPISSGIGNR